MYTLKFKLLCGAIPLITSVAFFSSIKIKNGIAGTILKIQTTQEPTDSIPPDHTGMRNITSIELTREMVAGWNLGNSLDAVGGETAWGNPKVTQQLIDSVKAAGFNAVRIPVAWSKFSDATTFKIDTNWIARVEQVVNYVLKDKMYAIINIHWDGGWMIPTYVRQNYVNNRLAIMWKQIAIHFRNYDDHLLFAGTNEVNNGYGKPTSENYAVQNSFIQTFVTTVRSTGGRNAYRDLVVQSYNTNIDHCVSHLKIPTDNVRNKLIVEVHYYDPFDFTIKAKSSITQWGKYATDPSKTETWANEAYADAQFQKMHTTFIQKGYAVIMGEYGTMALTLSGTASINAKQAFFRNYYMRYITHSSSCRGIIPFYWDNGYITNHGMGLFNRNTGAKAYPDVIRAITGK